VLRIDNLCVRYGGIVAVRDVSLEVHASETVLLVGANGAGKSSLINAVIGMVPAAAGTIAFEGRSLDNVACAMRARAGIGYSPEGRRVFPSLSVRENVLAGAIGAGIVDKRERYDWLCGAFPLLAERARQPAGQLSGGQQQIVALARAMSAFPKLLLLDEPFLGLAPVWIDRISDAVRQMQGRGTTILMTEQMARPALRLADRAYVMRGGEIRRSGSADEIRAAALADEYL
jgi:branched-chain amino acid transport system ATP-binding protein